MKKAKKKIKIAYVSGNVDATAVYEEWSASRKSSYFGTSYARQFFDVCAGLDAQGLIVSTASGKSYRSEKGRFRIENRPSPRSSGLLYHVSLVIWFLRLILSLLRFRTDVLVITAHQNYWFILIILKLFDVKIIPSVHSCLWTRFSTTPWHWRLLIRLNKFFYSKLSSFVLVASQEIGDQITELTKNHQIKMALVLPTYSKEQFGKFASTGVAARPPFRILFVGRLQANKGIYDLLEIAKRLESERKGEFAIDVCGTGPEIETFVGLINKFELSGIVTCHGQCDANTLAAIMRSSHVMIVPSTTQCEEGFNNVCAEAILAIRPVVTSAVCPALNLIKGAAVEVPPDDVDAYFRAIIRLSEDGGFFEEKREACRLYQEQFYNPDNGWGANLRNAIEKITT